MDFFEVVRKRRSIRKFTPERVPEAHVRRALDAAVLAPNSSNVQTWDFHWVKNPEKKARLVDACFAQSAARTASELVVITADPAKWRRSQKALVDWVKTADAPPVVHLYYAKLIPVTYRWGLFNSFAILKTFASFVVGWFRPIARGPHTRGELQLVAVKSAALAAENFVLALTAQGLASCMMEGFDEVRVKRLLGLRRSTRVVMVVGIGYEGERGTWGPQFRLPNHEIIHEVD